MKKITREGKQQGTEAPISYIDPELAQLEALAKAYNNKEAK